MDLDSLLQALPDNAAFNAMFPYRRKELAESFVEAILDAIQADGREPDDWETADLAAAIGFIACHWHNAALAAAERALTPPAQRSPIARMKPAGSSPMRHLRNGLEYVRGMPARAV
jgi:AcrR family transcriptional regulator